MYCHLGFDDFWFGSCRKNIGCWFIRKVMNSYQITFLYILQGMYRLSHNSRSPRPDLKPGNSSYAGWIRHTRRRPSVKRKHRCSGNTQRRSHCSASSVCITYVQSSSSEKRRTIVKRKPPKVRKCLSTHDINIVGRRTKLCRHVRTVPLVYCLLSHLDASEMRF